MNNEMSVNFSFRIQMDNIPLSEIIGQFLFLVTELNNLLGQQYEWFETGYSKKEALSHIAFKNNEISKSTLLKWEGRYKKEYPIFVESVWDGKGDYSNAINYRKMFFEPSNRVNVELHLVSQSGKINVNSFVELFSKISFYFECSYINADNKGYRFFDKNVFPDRLSVGWMLYVPHVLLPELIPEAARVIPVMDGKQQKGTIVVSTEEIFDGNNKEHIGKANDIEIKLLDLGLLPLMTEL
ncbi:Imm52 family immunity protein [Atlantibacter hermannii]|uniref:Imm52 family immunity protein n=1 Tax=Atlantibacter hermannii TaxID=565 RepID=UPI002074115C|nr:Imm52 family immunity protein [Atlantibacter hermannii]